MSEERIAENSAVQNGESGDCTPPEDPSCVGTTPKMPESSQNGPSSTSKDADLDIVTPWEVAAASATGVDYDKLLDRFGCQKLDTPLVERIERVTGKPAHHLLRRGMFFAHRELNAILDRYEKGQPFFLYTGRGPSSDAMHLGHMIPFYFTKYMQEAFDVPLVIQLTDDEKFLWKDQSLEESNRLAYDNIRDIIAVGFDPEKTFIFADFDFVGLLYTSASVTQWISVLQVNKYAFSGGRDTAEEHRKFGGNCDVDVSFQYLRYFLEDDEQLAKIRKDYTSGELLTGYLKKELIDLLQKFISSHQQKRKAVTEELIRKFTEPRKLKYDY